MAGFCASAGTQVVGVLVLADPTLTVSNIGSTPTGISMLVAGGTSAVALPIIEVSVQLANGASEGFEMTQPIIADSFVGIPAAAVSLGGQVLTYGGAPITLAATA